ncbi:DNA adenine methylase [Erysipelothrix sp. HDW6C]|uniref:DNA adenine methylase n=1 Tax=Erysipelothrix sp. HDW6C TaxID=2714930 RepID=UPI001408AA73|nr:DNA adenine methylase [Erysipelothrix sp. HDW6C]QIK70266.1 DNA adenine methylase [Erysipelothrix sp. HDW6C]
MNSIVKWVGGKKQLLPELKENMPKKYNRYFEAFLGGGALLFALKPEIAYVNDLNSELINLYVRVKNSPKKLMTIVDDLALELIEDEDYYYYIRQLDRKVGLKNLTPTFRAARFLFLNKAGYNGLYRVNSSGHNNVPFAKKTELSFYTEENIESVSKYLKNKEIHFHNTDYKKFLAIPVAGDFVYLDPPYIPVSETASFTSYQKDGFSFQDQIELRDLCLELTERGVHLMLSNSDVPKVHELYSNECFNIKIVTARRSINSNGDGRGNVNEVLITNYDLEE